MNLVCATTMNKEYYNTIGKLMLRSWMKFFPADATLYLYLEDFKLELQSGEYVAQVGRKKFAKLIIK